MPTTNDHSIYYPSAGEIVAPLHTKFATLAQSSDTAISEAMDTVRDEINSMFAPSAAVGTRTADFSISNTITETVIPVQAISRVRGNPAPVISNNGIMVRVPGTYYIRVRGVFQGSSSARWRNINVTVNGDRILSSSSVLSESDRPFEASEMIELDANDIVRMTTHASEYSTGMRAASATTLSITRVGPKGV